MRAKGACWTLPTAQVPYSYNSPWLASLRPNKRPSHTNDESCKVQCGARDGTRHGAIVLRFVHHAFFLRREASDTTKTGAAEPSKQTKLGYLCLSAKVAQSARYTVTGSLQSRLDRTTLTHPVVYVWYCMGTSVALTPPVKYCTKALYRRISSKIRTVYIVFPSPALQTMVKPSPTLCCFCSSPANCPFFRLPVTTVSPLSTVSVVAR